jgi:hypothetical protein
MTLQNSTKTLRNPRNAAEANNVVGMKFGAFGASFARSFNDFVSVLIVVA